jgi:hypothetical protein
LVARAKRVLEARDDLDGSDKAGPPFLSVLMVLLMQSPWNDRAPEAFNPSG